MRHPRFAVFLAVSVLLINCAAPAQDFLGNALKMSFTDVAETKRRAEAGDPAAQLSLANTLLSSLRPADALPWFRKAAEQGRLEGVFWIGNLLLNGASGVPAEKSVKADPAVGIQFMFCAATNRYGPAYYEMHKAYRDGRGVAKDAVQAYAWLQLDVDSSPGLLTGSLRQSELNRLALDVDVGTSQAGKRLAGEFKAGHWPILTVLQPARAPSVATPPKPVPAVLSAPRDASDPGLKLNGIAYGSTPLAIINGKGVAEGETVTLRLKPSPITLKCVRIETNAAVVLIQGEDAVRRLLLK